MGRVITADAYSSITRLSRRSLAYFRRSNAASNHGPLHRAFKYLNRLVGAERTTEDKTSPLPSPFAIFRFAFNGGERNPRFRKFQNPPRARIENSPEPRNGMTHISNILYLSPSPPFSQIFLRFVLGPLNLADTSSTSGVDPRLCTLDEPFRERERERKEYVFSRRMRVDLGADSHRTIGHDLRSPFDDASWSSSATTLQPSLLLSQSRSPCWKIRVNSSKRFMYDVLLYLKFARGTIWVTS